MFIFHQVEHGNHKMDFRMHESGLNYYEPKYEDFVFFNTVTGNKESYKKQKIKADEQAR